MRSTLIAVSGILLLASQPALADWAVAQSNNDQPFAQRFRTPDMARQAVMDACTQRYQNCRVVIAGETGCVAIATAGNQWGVAKGGM